MDDWTLDAWRTAQRSLFLLVPVGRGRLLQQLDAAEVEDVLNFAYDAGAIVPTKATEAPHFRRVATQRRILDQYGVDPIAALGLGRLYQWLRSRLHELGLDDTPRRVRRPPLDVNAARGFVFVSDVGDVHPSGFLPLAAANVRRRALTDIFRDTPLFTTLRDPDALTGRCGHCEFRAVCGGSRSVPTR